jgi:hypothetical protein
LVPVAFAVVSTTNPHWPRVVGYDLFSLCIIHKEGLCPSSGDINGLMMIMIHFYPSIIAISIQIGRFGIVVGILA